MYVDDDEGSGVRGKAFCGGSRLVLPKWRETIWKGLGICDFGPLERAIAAMCEPHVMPRSRQNYMTNDVRPRTLRFKAGRVQRAR